MLNHPTRIHPELKRVPDNLLPPGLQPEAAQKKKSSFTHARTHNRSGPGKKSGFRGNSGGGKRKQQDDPLKKFAFNPAQKKSKTV